jgi:hypothetical protein
MKYRVEQIQSDTWRLCMEIESGGWKLVGDFGSEADATAAMNVEIARSEWIAPPSKIYDGTGALMANEGEDI